MTVRGVKVNSARRLLENTLNYLKFDCFSEEGIRCAKETARIRSDFRFVKHFQPVLIICDNTCSDPRPFIVRVLKAKYKETSAMLSKLVKERTFDDEDDASLFLCRLSLTPRYRPHWGQVIELLFLAEDSEDIASLEEQLLSAVADHFRLHVDSFFARLAEIFGEPLDLEPPHKLRTRPCFKELGLFESNAKIFVASVLSLLGDEKELPLGTMLTVGKSRIGEKALEVDLDGVITQEQTDAHEIVRKLPLLLLSGAGNDSTRMVTADNLFHYLTAWFSGLPESPDSSSISCNVEDNVILMTYPELGGNNSTSLCEESQDEGCCMLQDIIRSNRHASVKLAKYDYQPASREIAQRGEMEDAIHLANAFDYKTLDQVPETSSPMFIGCKYADSHGTSDCSSYFSPVYNTDGVGYTFNHARFYEIFKQTEFNDMFYKEINRKKEEQGFRYIRGHGRAFSLYFFVKPDNFDSAHMDNYISVHSPFQLADLESAVFKLEPGWTYTMVVDPSVVETDQGALAMDPETRGCLSAVDDGHGLKAFRRYTQASCLFECHLRVASSRCNCTPWDYLVVPGEDSSWPVCNVVETQFCFEVALSEPVNSTYCDCPNNCEELQYPHSVLMERTKKELCTITYDDAFVQ